MPYFIIIIMILALTGCGVKDFVTDKLNDDEFIEDVEEILDTSGGIADVEEEADEVPADTSGGVEYEDGNYYESVEPLNLLGTYSKLVKSAYYYDGNRWAACEYGFPTSVRVYSHDTQLDFEDLDENLLWVADSLEDETFTFGAVFLNSLGQPSVDVDCVCYIEDEYYSYHNDQVRCMCESDENSCKITWEKLE